MRRPRGSDLPPDVQQRLAGHAAAIQAFPAGAVALHQGHSRPQLGAGDPGDQTGGAAADNDEVPHGG